jgi:hypothetical protein
MAKKPEPKKTVYRDSKDGQFVKKSEAERKPSEYEKNGSESSSRSGAKTKLGHCGPEIRTVGVKLGHHHYSGTGPFRAKRDQGQI